MNKAILSIVLASVLLVSIGIVSAEADGTGPYHDEIVAAGGLNGTGDMVQAMNQTMTQLKDGTYNAGDGKQLQVMAKEGKGLKLRAGDVEADTELEVSSDGQKLKAKLSNGRNAEIKIMPDTASETALERLRLRNCTEDNNCTLELKQVGEGEQARLAYEVQAERHAKILGLFQAKMQTRVQVDAENGEVLKVGKPWWSFLATEPAEEAEE